MDAMQDKQQFIEDEWAGIGIAGSHPMKDIGELGYRAENETLIDVEWCLLMKLSHLIKARTDSSDLPLSNNNILSFVLTQSLVSKER